MPPKEKKVMPAGEEEEPLEEDKELVEKELVISYLKMKLAACASALICPGCAARPQLRPFLSVCMAAPVSPPTRPNCPLLVAHALHSLQQALSEPGALRASTRAVQCAQPRRRLSATPQPPRLVWMLAPHTSESQDSLKPRVMRAG